MPAVSIIVTSYNQSSLLCGAIDSALSQTFPPTEIIVCDDASADDSRDMIASYAARHPNLIRPIFQEQNVGVSRNRNAGLTAASGDYVTWFDGDDFIGINKLALEFDLITRSANVQWVYSQVYVVDQKGTILGTRFRTAPEGQIFSRLLSMLGRAPRSLFVNRNALNNVGLFDEELNLYEDFDLCLRLGKAYRCAYCATPVSYYRVHTGGLHKSPRHEHVRNLTIIQNHLAELTSEQAPHDRKRLLNIFLNQMDLSLMRKAAVERDRNSLWRQGRRLLMRSPGHVFHKDLYRILLRALRTTRNARTAS